MASPTSRTTTHYQQQQAVAAAAVAAAAAFYPSHPAYAAAPDMYPSFHAPTGGGGGGGNKSMQTYMNPSLQSHYSNATTAEAEAAAAAAAVGLSGPSLPPLSQLLPPSKQQQQACEDQHAPQPRTDPSMVYHQHQTTTVPSHGKSMIYPSQVDPVYPHGFRQQQQQQHPYYVVPGHPMSNYPPATQEIQTVHAVVPSSMVMANPASAAMAVYPSHMPYARHDLPSPPPSVADGLSPTTAELNQQKVFSFVSLPGVSQKKRPRRKYHEVERLYHCSYPGCSKSYGTLNHLNAHVCMQGHGPKRHPVEFKELRKQWRKQKREQQHVSKKKNEDHAMPQQPHSIPPLSSSLQSSNIQHLPLPGMYPPWDNNNHTLMHQHPPSSAYLSSATAHY
ncbi:hypothetical protein DFQ30_010991 [Apophysomyces sp. BC1015]|nr:hypothetical protein DFQ30_010991 [Apophysomyces sp. BC1015]